MIRLASKCRAEPRRAVVIGVALAACLSLSSVAIAADGPATAALTPLDDKPEKKPEEAKAKYSTEVLVLHATNSGKGIDKRIGEMPQLKKPPFSSYDSYELLVKQSLPLIKGHPETMELPNKRVLRTELLEELPKGYLKLGAAINQPGGKDFLPLLEVKAKAGQSFIVAGQSYKGGILVLVIRVVENKPEAKKD
ncbi:MAG: hypothetical protein R3B07_21610 [Polyangiaceae bacterium]